jgi:hypothetical protein
MTRQDLLGRNRADPRAALGIEDGVERHQSQTLGARGDEQRCRPDHAFLGQSRGSAGPGEGSPGAIEDRPGIDRFGAGLGSSFSDLKQVDSGRRVRTGLAQGGRRYSGGIGGGPHPLGDLTELSLYFVGDPLHGRRLGGAEPRRFDGEADAEGDEGDGDAAKRGSPRPAVETGCRFAPENAGVAGRRHPRRIRARWGKRQAAAVDAGAIVIV